MAQDFELDVRIAVKLLHPRLATADGAVAFMKNECRAARRLNHPYIVRVYDFHQLDDLAFISMEWIEGPTFDSWLPSATVDQGNLLRILNMVAGALGHIHHQGLVHRDVKARNILITPTGQPKLTDFGIVGLWRFQPGMLDVKTGGSHASMSPQQREGQSPHPADDIFALGVLLHEILTGAKPRPEPREPAATTETQAPDLETLSAPPASEQLLKLAARMQAPARDDRPASMAAVQKIIDAALITAGHRTTPPDADIYPSAETPSSLPADHIAPQPYTPTAEPSAAASRQRPILWTMVLVMGAFGLMAAGIGIIGYLARQPTEATAPATTPPAAAPRPLPEKPDGDNKGPAKPSEIVPSDKALEMAEKNMALWLRVSDQLKAADAGTWAPEKFEMIEAHVQAADDAMMADTYAQAAEAYATAVAEGEALLSSRETLYTSAMEEGTNELQADRPAQARTHFERALKIKPDDVGARQGMTAVDKREKVLAIMASGQSHETEGRYDLALADFETALQLDNDFAAARAAVDRLKNQVAETQYKRLVSEGLSAFYQNRFKDARGHIQAALQYRPGGQEAREALRQIDAGAREQRIARLRRRGRVAENEEQWDRALKSYEETLAIDPALHFARLGAARSRDRIRFDKRLRYYLDHPEVLASERYLDEARQLLFAVEALEPRGPRLAGQIQTLQTSIQNAQAIISLTLLSDGQTEVAVLRVARLGRITRQTLELRPGIYTIVGARNGYKDVRQTIRIEADQQALQVSIACKEKI